MSDPEPKPVRASMTVISDLMNPSLANNHGTVFGGVILAMVDKAAGVAGTRHAGQICVTVAMERVEFLVPIAMGDLVTAEARLTHAGKTSMDISVEVYAEQITKGTRQHANSCLVTMVAIDDNGRPSSVPGLLLETPKEKADNARALERRKNRSQRSH